MFSTRLQRAYPSDLTDAQWELPAPLIPPVKADAAYHLHERREIVNAILYVLCSGCPWRSLPHDLPAWGTVYHSFRLWQREGVWDRVLEALRMQVRQKQGRDAQPSAGIIDSQSIKTSAVRGPEKGFDMGKKNWGRKRHVLVDSQGNLLAVKVTGAERSDQEGGRALLLPLKEQLPSMKLLWGDSHYAGQMITWMKVNLGWTMQPVRALTVPSAESSCPRERKWIGTNSFLQDSVRSPEDRWWSGASPGSRAGVGSAAIMRGCQKALRPSSSSQPATAC